MISMNKMSIYVSSFDGYSDLWDTFFDIFDIFWNDCSFPIYLINNEKPFQHKQVKVIHTGKEINWFHRTIDSLQHIESKYILFMLEDYLISKKICESDFENILSFMDKKDVFCYRLSPHKLKKGTEIYCEVPWNAKYPINLQPAIWNREIFLNILKSISGETPWDFEYYFDNKDYSENKHIQGLIYDNRDILGYKNGVLRGKWIPKTIKEYKKIGIKIDTSNRGLVPNNVYYKYLIADLIGSKIPTRMRQPIKKCLKIMGIKYL